MHGIILEATNFVIGASQFISFTCDEVSTIDNQSQLLVHAHMVQNWLWIPILLSLECVVARSCVDNLIHVLVLALRHEGGLMKYLINKKLMTFSTNGVFFPNTRSNDIWQISNGWAPHSMGVHYMVHRTNVVVETLSYLQMVNIIEGLFQTLYNYFSKSLKRHFKFTKFEELMETKGAKILKNVKTHWIYVVPCLTCNGKIQNFVDEDGLWWSY